MNSEEDKGIAKPVVEPLMLEEPAAKSIGIKPRRLRDARYRGEVTHVIMAGHAMYRAGHLEDWIRRNTCPERRRTSAHST